jgi:WD40 repeat protein
MLIGCARACALILLLHLMVCAQQPELVVQKGHAEDIYTVAFSPDERLLASGSMDTWVLLWDVQTGRLLRRLGHHAAKVMSVKFSADGRLIASGSLDHTIKLWDVQTGELLRTLESQYAVEHLNFSADNQTIVSEGETPANQYAVELWETATGRLRTTFALQPSRELATPLGAAATSPDGNIIAALGYDGGFRLWHAPPQQQPASVQLIDLLTAKPETEVQGVFLSFSPNGLMIATALSDAEETTIKLWEVGTMRALREFKVRAGYAVNDDGAVCWDQTGELITVGNTVFEVGSGRKVRDLKIAPEDILSPRGRLAAAIMVGTTDNARQRSDTIQVKDVTSGAIINRLQGLTEAVSAISFADNNRKLVIEADETANVRVFDTHGGGLVSASKKECRAGCAFSPDGTLRATWTSPRTIKISKRADNSLQRTLNIANREQATEQTPNLYFSRDNQRLLIVSHVEGGASANGIADMVDVYDLRSGLALARLRGQLAAVSPGAHLIALADGGRSGLAFMRLRFFDGQTGRLLRQFETKIKQAEGGALEFSPEGTQLVWSNETRTRVFASATGLQNYELRGRFSNFGAGGQTMITASIESGSVEVWARESGQLMRHFANLQSVTAVTTTTDGRVLLVGTGDSRLTFWSVKSGELLGTLFMLKGGDWLAATPEGLFDGSPAAWQQIIWRFSPALNDVAPTEVFFNDFYYPALLSSLLAGEQPRAATALAQKDRRQPQLTLQRTGQASVPQSLSPRDVAVTINITNAPAGAQDVRLFRNGSLVHVWHGDVLQGKSEAKLMVNVPLIAGENRLTAYAFNQENVKSSDAVLNITGASALKRQGIAYVLAVGVNSYANKDFDLKYAVADAQDFSKEWQTQQTRLAAYTPAPPVVLSDAQATKENILKALTDLKAKVKPEDALVIYFAGHGTAQANRFYLIPHDLGYEGGRDAIDEAGLKTILAHSVSDLELQDALEGVDAGQLLMVIDACNSGQALESEEKRRGPMNSKGLAQLAYEKGMYILTAAQSYQAAQEASKFGHGFLTFALVEEGIKQSKADGEPKDGKVIVREWFNYATQRVPQLQMELMAEAQKQRGVKVAFVKGEEQIAEPANRNVQHPRVFYRRELEALPFIIALP